MFDVSEHSVPSS